jgi:hypothetical protein
VQLAIRAALLLCVALPAVLPLVALAGWTAALVRSRAERKWAAEQAIPYLLAAMAVYIAIEYPRADVMHLAFVAPLAYVLAGGLAARYLPRSLTIGLVLFFGVGAVVFAAHTAGDLIAGVPVSTPAGGLRASPEDAAALRTLLAVVSRGHGLYVHPYMPLLYFLTQTANPTRFSYLAPGMMTRQEELTALDELRANPPPWILYLPVPRAEFLRIFPNAGELDHRFPALEAWIGQEYKPHSPPLSLATYQLYSRK